MKKQNQIWMGVAALMLILMYVFPIWAIRLDAPQYPEGIGLNIKINNVEGQHPNDLQNINNLNHYIGMKAITPDAIPELVVMPVVIGLLIISGLGIASWGNPKWILGWIIAFSVLALAGLVDFYIWEYDYGHDLNPNAPIKVPGMSYQPPLLGTKQLLNMKTTSMPHVGFYIALISMAMAGWAWWNKEPKRKGEKPFRKESQKVA